MASLNVVVECIWCWWQRLRFHLSIKGNWPWLIYIADIGNVIYAINKCLQMATFSSMNSHPPSPFRRRPSARELFNAVLFEWPNRKHVSLPVIAWNVKSRFAAIGSKLLLHLVQSGGPVTIESIVRFDILFELFEVLRNNLAPTTLVKMAAEFVRNQNAKWPPLATLEMQLENKLISKAV